MGRMCGYENGKLFTFPTRRVYNFPWFMCLWDSRGKGKHWEQKLLPVRKLLTAGENIMHQLLVEQERITFLPHHIRLQLMKQFVKALDVEGDCLKFIFTTFPGLSYDKIKAGVPNGTKFRNF